MPDELNKRGQGVDHIMLMIIMILVNMNLSLVGNYCEMFIFYFFSTYSSVDYPVQSPRAQRLLLHSICTHIPFTTLKLNGYIIL